jgi:predicted HicB family RNase H-like nuclease
MVTETIPERANRLAARPYTFTLVQSSPESDVWTSGVLEVPGAINEGADPNEAITRAQEALEAILEVRLEDGLEIPEPLETRRFSGRMQLRLNPELHQIAVMRAAQENVSLNRWLSASIARSTGIAAAPAPQPRPAPVAEEHEDYDTHD